jgi:hypothetical protein
MFRPLGPTAWEETVVDLNCSRSMISQALLENKFVYDLSFSFGTGGVKNQFIAVHTASLCSGVINERYLRNST